MKRYKAFGKIKASQPTSYPTSSFARLSMVYDNHFSLIACECLDFLWLLTFDGTRNEQLNDQLLSEMINRSNYRA